MEEENRTVPDVAAEPEQLPPPVNAEARLTITKDELEASIEITPPENGGADLSYESLKLFLTQKGVTFGVDDAVLRSLAESPAYNAETVVARGVQKVDGENAEIIYHVETDPHIKPKEREDGTVDFRDMGTIQDVKKDTLLCEKKPLSKGTTGTSVTNKTTPAVPGRDAVMPAGKNTVLSDDKLKLLAATDGHVSVISGKINILDVFTVQGDVSALTGNINFSGGVIVKGDVHYGFSIKAAGDVTVNGVVEGAKIMAGGSLIIRGGFRSGELNVGANAACSFIEGGRVTVKGNLDTSYIINATVKCGGAIQLRGKGLIRGGHVTARTSVTANLIGGTTSAAKTVIEVGADPIMLERFKEVSEEIIPYERNIADLKLGVNSLLKLKEAGLLTPKKADNLERINAYLEVITPTHLELKEELDTLKTQIDKIGYGIVKIKGMAYHGSKIIIGHEALVLNDDYSCVTFFRNEEGITSAPFR
ncbi:MAG: FapA family protein [Acidobacteriota bacterium]|jgi:uncharacterized protein (DUF342 family)|nr:FapA family protein [Acidobacteriota bacterium]